MPGYLSTPMYTSRSSTRAGHGSEHGGRSAERLEFLTAGGSMP